MLTHFETPLQREKRFIKTVCYYYPVKMSKIPATDDTIGIALGLVTFVSSKYCPKIDVQNSASNSCHQNV